MKRNLAKSLLFLSCAIGLLISCGIKRTPKEKYVEESFKEIEIIFPEAQQVGSIKDSIKIIFPNNVVFDVSSSKINVAFEQKLYRFGEILRKYDSTNLLITGYTDASGNDQSNLSLSLARANSVKDYLVTQIIAPERLFTWGLGKKSPIASNKTIEGRIKNRRVEFVVLYEPTE